MASLAPTARAAVAAVLSLALSGCFDYGSLLEGGGADLTAPPPDLVEPTRDLAGTPPADLTPPPPPADLFTDDRIVPAGCDDEARNQDETGVDCGGSICPRCPLTAACRATTDCATGGQCLDGRCAAPLAFAPVATTALGREGRRLSAADANADGRVDLAVVAADGAVLLVLRAPAAPGFLPRELVSLPLPAGHALLADLDGDRSGDLAATHPTAARATVVLAGSNGRGGSTVALTVGAGPQAVAAADLDGDRRLDLITANADAGSVSVALASATGGFRPPVATPAGAGPRAIAAADLDGDGKLDLVVASAGAGGVAVLRGRGDGTFLPAVATATDREPVAVIAADLDGDGVVDVATANRAASPNHVTVLRGRGDGTFLAPVHHRSDPAAAQAGPVALAVADFNRDGRPDLAVANGGAGNVGLLLGGSAGLRAPMTLSLPQPPTDLVTIDLDDDGLPDLAATLTGVDTLATLANRSR